MASRRDFHRGRQSPRRRTGWEEGPGQSAPQTAITGTVAAIAASIAAATVDGLTIARIRARLQMYLSTTNAALEGFHGAFGIGVVTTAALTAGAASIPTPITEQSWDGWMYWRSLNVTSGPIFLDGTAASEGDGIAGVVGSIDVDVDVKAMRKLTVDEAIFAVVEVTEIGTAVMQWHFDSRVLLFLP